MQPIDDARIKRTPLEDEHRDLGAKLGPFGGWLMPIAYEGAIAEHRAVRERVGLFDLSHLGKVDVDGPEALAALQGALTNDLARLDVGRGLYNLCSMMTVVSSKTSSSTASKRNGGSSSRTRRTPTWSSRRCALELETNR